MPDIDIVLMDIMMPVMDGYETIRAIRAIDRFKSLPIIAVTGKVAAGERQRCIDAGANDYVPKPVDTAELLAALRPWLPATPSLPDPLEPAGVHAGSSPDPTARSDSAIDGMKILVVDDDFRNIFAHDGTARTRTRRRHRRRERRRRPRRAGARYPTSTSC